MSRFQQRVTALNFAIQTTPPPDSQESRRRAARVSTSNCSELYMNGNALDLARDRLQLVLDTSQPEDFTAEVRAQFKKQLDELDQHMKLVEDSLVELETERQAGPVEQADFAASGELPAAPSRCSPTPNATISAPRPSSPGSSICIATPASRTRPSTCSLPPSTTPISAPSRARGHPGRDESTFLSGELSLREQASGGNGRSRGCAWTAAAATLEAARVLFRGEAVHATDLFLTVPGTLAKQASWEFDLAMCELEAGLPADAAEHFANALTWAPDLAVRPIAAYYLEKMGKPVPELTKGDSQGRDRFCSGDGHARREPGPDRHAGENQRRHSQRPRSQHPLNRAVASKRPRPSHPGTPAKGASPK